MEQQASRTGGKVGLAFAFVLASVALVSLATAGPASALSAAGLTTDGRLVTFQTVTPGTLTSGPTQITGLQPGESVLGIDVRPATSELYALGSSSRLYTLNLSTAEAAQVGSGPFTPSLSGTAFGFDFNPTVDRIRAVSDMNQNLRLNPNNGVVTFTDTNLQYGVGVGDPNEGVDPIVAASAYSNNFDGAGLTTLYAIDSGLDILTAQIPPNDGTLNTIGPLGLNTDERVGFDIHSPNATNALFASLTLPGATESGLYTVNLSTGASTLIGVVGPGGFALHGLALGVPPLQPPNPQPPANPPPAAATGQRAAALKKCKKKKSKKARKKCKQKANRLPV